MRVPRQAVERGELVELVMLEDKVRAMCESIQALSKQEMNRFADDLEHMHKELDALQGMLIKAREALRDELVGLDHHRKANVAYKASESLQGQPKTDGDEAAEEKA